MKAPQLMHNQPQQPQLMVKPEDEDEDSFTIPVELMSARGVFLLTMAITSFAAFTQFALAELTHHHPAFLIADVLRGNTHGAAQWALQLSVPVTSAAAWFPTSTSCAHTEVIRIKTAVPVQFPAPDSPALSLFRKLARRYRRNRIFAIYQSIGWALYGLCVALQLICLKSTNVMPFCRPGSRSVQAVVAFIAEVLIISSVLTLEKRCDRNQQRRKDRFVVHLNNYNNMLLLVGATVLALASEFTRMFPHQSGSSVGYSLTTGLGSLALFVTALFNTYGLGGVLSTKDGWSFYQPLMGGARFVVIQIVSWVCFGAGIALQVLYLISLSVVELEVFVGAMALAGSLFVVAEIGIMMSLLVFKKSGHLHEQLSLSSCVATPFVDNTTNELKPTSSTKKAETAATGLTSLHAYLLTSKRMRDFANECLGVLVVGVMANLQYIPNVFLVVFFFVTTNLSPAGVAFYGICATGIEFVMVMSRSFATHLYLKDSHNGLLKDVNQYYVKYVLPQLITACLPAVLTYKHYIHEMDAFVPVLVLTVSVYVYQLTYRGNPQQTGCRERASWVTGRSFLVDTVKKYFNGTIIRMAPLDPEKQYVLSFHPHGIMPLSVMWLQFTDQWRQLFPNLYAHILTASILHQIPLARDVLHYYGSREVTRAAFAHTLQQKESVLVVPGGQAEMLQQQSAKNEVRIYTHHKGFIRLAIEHGVPLVPILSFKEGELMDNVQSPVLQRWFVKKFAFPFPYYPYGRGMLPIPRKINIPVVVGEPLKVPHIKLPTHEDIDHVHAKYFAVLKDMFDKYKDEVGCGDYKLILI